MRMLDFGLKMNEWICVLIHSCKNKTTTQHCTFLVINVVSEFNSLTAAHCVFEWRIFYFDDNHVNWSLQQIATKQESYKQPCLTDSNGNYISIRLNVVKFRHYFKWLWVLCANHRNIYINKSVCEIRTRSVIRGILPTMVCFQFASAFCAIY